MEKVKRRPLPLPVSVKYGGRSTEYAVLRRANLVVVPVAEFVAAALRTEDGGPAWAALGTLSFLCLLSVSGRVLSESWSRRHWLYFLFQCIWCQRICRSTRLLTLLTQLDAQVKHCSAGLVMPQTACCFSSKVPVQYLVPTAEEQLPEDT